MTTEHRESDPYWQDVADLGLIFYSHAHRPLRARSHREQERFRGVGSAELFQVAIGEGTRDYVASRLYIPDNGIHRDLMLASAQAWHYPADRTVVLWELIPEHQLAITDPRESLLYRTLWLRYEAFLTDHFAGVTTLLTTWEDEFDRDQWAGFLSGIGYVKTAPAVFTKTR